MVTYRDGTKRIQNQFTDYAGNPYDPDSQVMKYYDPEGELKATKGHTDAVKTAVGTWYLDYVIPTDALYGRWLCVWGTVTGTELTSEPFAFIVGDTQWVTEQEVRDYLDAMPQERVDSPVVDWAILDACMFIDRQKSSLAVYSAVYQAYKSLAGYYVYRAYATEYERTAGEIPGPVIEHLDRYKEQAEHDLALILTQYSSGSTPQGLITLASIRTTSIDEYYKLVGSTV